MIKDIFSHSNKYGICAAPAKIIETELGKIKVGEGEHQLVNQGIGVLKCNKCGIIQAEIK